MIITQIKPSRTQKSFKIVQNLQILEKINFSYHSDALNWSPAPGIQHNYSVISQRLQVASGTGLFPIPFPSPPPPWDALYSLLLLKLGFLRRHTWRSPAARRPNSGLRFNPILKIGRNRRFPHSEGFWMNFVVFCVHAVLIHSPVNYRFLFKNNILKSFLASRSPVRIVLLLVVLLTPEEGANTGGEGCRSALMNARERLAPIMMRNRRIQGISEREGVIFWRRNGITCHYCLVLGRAPEICYRDIKRLRVI